MGTGTALCQSYAEGKSFLKMSLIQVASKEIDLRWGRDALVGGVLQAVPRGCKFVAANS